MDIKTKLVDCATLKVGDYIFYQEEKKKVLYISIKGDPGYITISGMIIIPKDHMVEKIIE